MRQSVPYTELFFYQKADAIYRLTYIFCQRFLPKYGDRTVDQMVQAARSGKQNIVEGIEDGNTSTEMELKLLNVSRSSLQELREDYNAFYTRAVLLVGHRNTIVTMQCLAFASIITRQKIIFRMPTGGRQRSFATRCSHFATSQTR